MRLLLVSHSANDPNGGASRVYHFLTEGLAARGHEVQCLHLDDVEIPRALEKFATRLLLPSFVSRAAARVIKRNMAPFDVIISSNGMLAPLYRQLQREPDRPLLVNHLHGLTYFYHQSTMDEVLRGNMKVSWIYRRCTGRIPQRWDLQGMQYSDLAIVQNKRDEDFLGEKGFRYVKWIPLAVHPKILAAGASAPMQTERDPMRLFWFGSWTVGKGTNYVPRAFEQICTRFPKARLTIGGTGATQEEIRAYFNESLRGNIRVLTKITIQEQIAELRENAIFLFPSLSEGFGFAPLEALAMRMALVTTQAGFGGDLLVDRHHARIIPVASALHLAEAVIELMEHPELRQQLAKHGRELAETLTLERMLDSYERTLTAALEERNRGALNVGQNTAESNSTERQK